MRDRESATDAVSGESRVEPCCCMAQFLFKRHGRIANSMMNLGSVYQDKTEQDVHCAKRDFVLESALSEQSFGGVLSGKLGCCDYFVLVSFTPRFSMCFLRALMF